MECKILEKQDLDQMKEILEDDHMEFDILKLKEFLQNESTLSFIAKEKDRIIGLVYGYDIVHPDGKHAYFIYSVGILPEYQNRGYGTKLLQFTKNYCKSHNFSEMFVMTDKGNQRACHVYEKLGGKNEYEDEICYVIDLR